MGEKLRNQGKQSYDEERSIVLQRAKLHYQQNREKKLKYAEEYRKNNIDKIKKSRLKLSVKEISRQYRIRHLEELRNRDRLRRKERKALIINHYSNGKNSCSCCGERQSFLLTIDHIHGDGLQHRRQLGGAGLSSGNFYAWLVRNNFPEGYQVLCMPCNSSKCNGPFCLLHLQQMKIKKK